MLLIQLHSSCDEPAWLCTHSVTGQQTPESGKGTPGGDEQRNEERRVSGKTNTACTINSGLTSCNGCRPITEAAAAVHDVPSLVFVHSLSGKCLMSWNNGGFLLVELSAGLTPEKSLGHGRVFSKSESQSPFKGYRRWVQQVQGDTVVRAMSSARLVSPTALQRKVLG